MIILTICLIILLLTFFLIILKTDRECLKAGVVYPSPYARNQHEILKNSKRISSLRKISENIGRENCFRETFGLYGWA